MNGSRVRAWLSFKSSRISERPNQVDHVLGGWNPQQQTTNKRRTNDKQMMDESGLQED